MLKLDYRSLFSIVMLLAMAMIVFIGYKIYLYPNNERLIDAASISLGLVIFGLLYSAIVLGFINPPLLRKSGRFIFNEAIMLCITKQDWRITNNKEHIRSIMNYERNILDYIPIIRNFQSKSHFARLENFENIRKETLQLYDSFPGLDSEFLTDWEEKESIFLATLYSSLFGTKEEIGFAQKRFTIKLYEFRRSLPDQEKLIGDLKILFQNADCDIQEYAKGQTYRKRKIANERIDLINYVQDYERYFSTPTIDSKGLFFTKDQIMDSNFFPKTQNINMLQNSVCYLWTYHSRKLIFIVPLVAWLGMNYLMFK